ncbi:hypothetical protein [Nostoc sp. GT001]|uniref:hypothetical protein n=1 Tax=Nostoc sp. GT001 TaxID=3056647 RepID=UPI0025AB3AC1|nr:hypothetical protein [Nostoc sp. GT001]MDM9582285.1 hypothetical protein [Nostoc sp. GT001]
MFCIIYVLQAKDKADNTEKPLIFALANVIACPGLGTGIGRVPYTEVAKQMALAYDHFLYPPKHLNCIVAAERQLQIWEGGDFR